ncbi:MAG: 3D domain-containing protein [Patescibacteria group bacterium]
MSIFFNSAKLTSLQRRLIILVVMVLVLTSSQVQSAEAMEFLPSVTTGTQVLSVNDNSSEATLKVPIVVKPINKIESNKVSETKTSKKKWSSANSADLETLPEHSSEQAVRTMVVPTSAYTSDPRECDSTPFVTANGTQVRDGIVAANFLKFGTRIRIPEYFGDKVFEVHDRMNARYNVRVDIWMLTKTDARAWGVRNVKIEILN